MLPPVVLVNPTISEAVALSSRKLHRYINSNLVPRALFPAFGGGAGKGPGIGRSIRHFDWLIDLGNLCKKMTK